MRDPVCSTMESRQAKINIDAMREKNRRGHWETILRFLNTRCHAAMKFGDPLAFWLTLSHKLSQSFPFPCLFFWLLKMSWHMFRWNIQTGFTVFKLANIILDTTANQLTWILKSTSWIKFLHKVTTENCEFPILLLQFTTWIFDNIQHRIYWHMTLLTGDFSLFLSSLCPSLLSPFLPLPIPSYLSSSIIAVAPYTSPDPNTEPGLTIMFISHCSLGVSGMLQIAHGDKALRYWFPGCLSFLSSLVHGFNLSQYIVNLFFSAGFSHTKSFSNAFTFLIVYEQSSPFSPESSHCFVLLPIYQLQICTTQHLVILFFLVKKCFLVFMPFLFLLFLLFFSVIEMYLEQWVFPL